MSVKVNYLVLIFERCVLKRENAVSILKELLEFAHCDSDFIALMAPDAKSTLTKGYQIQIKTSIDAGQREIIASILRREGLVLKEDNETLLIYRPV